MFNLQFDPVTTQLVIGKKKKKITDSFGGSLATMSALYVFNDLELQINQIIVKDYIEVAEMGSFTVAVDGAVEIT